MFTILHKEEVREAEYQSPKQEFSQDTATPWANMAVGDLPPTRSQELEFTQQSKAGTFHRPEPPDG